MTAAELHFHQQRLEAHGDRLFRGAIRAQRAVRLARLGEDMVRLRALVLEACQLSERLAAAASDLDSKLNILSNEP